MVVFLTHAPQRLYEYWLSLPRTGLLPQRASVDPNDLKDILPSISITEWHPPDDLRYRLAGTGVVDRFGFDPTGQNFLELVEGMEKAVLAENLRKIAETPCGLRSVREEAYQRGYRQFVEHAVLPLENDRSGGALLIAATAVVEPPESWTDKGTLSEMKQAREFEFIDIGAGVPD